MMLYPVMHLGDAHCCGKVGFYLMDPLRPGQALLAANVLMPDGKHPAPMDQALCGNCGRPMSGPTLAEQPEEVNFANL